MKDPKSSIIQGINREREKNACVKKLTSVNRAEKKRKSTGESIPVQARPIGVDKAAGRARSRRPMGQRRHRGKAVIKYRHRSRESSVGRRPWKGSVIFILCSYRKFKSST
jgi:hypothetical protein